LPADERPSAAAISSSGSDLQKSCVQVFWVHLFGGTIQFIEGPPTQRTNTLESVFGSLPLNGGGLTCLGHQEELFELLDLAAPRFVLGRPFPKWHQVDPGRAELFARLANGCLLKVLLAI
jgi:hypothetical protein